REVAMYKETGWDYAAPLVTLAMLKKAAEKADSIDPTDVAFALEGLSYDSLIGTVTMRADNHQLLMPMFISVLKDGVKYGAEGTDMNFEPITSFPAEDSKLPTTCKMHRPKR